ncbi:phage tail sheath subtilisin-like domain-containing protein [Salmonella enterica]|nr:phage tail sheath subtilisin-like domain-containing protein [Salmonella enterica]EKS4862809.1 phage tail sheath subtilisin-like domain-containing protein [Salmonella enterica]EKS4880522.1 phage tail sheath subtilisin-like domain-containing protein [Salmonella enterica]EKS4884981.1 phage tail sheath subtilisin-like domain-containing protein [Salmonella enterica]EKS5974637.1 phage tail sheath subtilisin-like domain-containing protein [Salmonella enterica]
MSTNFLHGVRTLEYDDGTKEISTVDISVIGIVGTAPGAQLATDATLTTGAQLLNNRLLFTALGQASAGNAWAVQITTGTPATAQYATQPDGSRHLLITAPETAKPGDIVDLITELNADTTTGALLNASAVDSTGTITAVPLSYLSGGSDEPFPLNKPAIIAGSTKKAACLGSLGTLPADVSDILNQADAMIVVVRVAEGNDATETQANVIAGLNQLTLSRQQNDIVPRIIIAPDFSATDPVAAQIEVVANRLRGVGYIDSPIAATPTDVVRRRQNYGSRIEILRPRVYTTSDTSGTPRPYSAIAAGHRCRIDNENGFWWSKSNQEIYGVTGLEQIDDFEIDSTTCTANQLNKNQVSTIIRYNGFRHWGNYLCSTDPQWAFECVRRTADDIEDSIAIAMMDDFIDRPIDAHLGSDIIETVNGYIRQLYELGAINGGKAWLDSELNTKESLAAGKLYINVEFAPKSPCQTITLTYRINNDYTVEEFASLLKAA